MKRLLIPVDFSAESLAVIEFAGRFFSADTKVTLLHVFQMPVIPGDTMAYYSDFQEFFQQHKETLEKNLAALASGSKFESDKIEVKVIDAIDNGVGKAISIFAEEQGFDLILSVAKERKGLEGVFMGTELFRTLRHTKVPVLVLRADNFPQALHRIALAIDFSEISQLAWKKVKPIADFLGAEVLCFYVNTADGFMSQRQFAIQKNLLVEETGINPFPDVIMYNDYTLEEGITHFVNEKQVDLLALNSHGRKGLARFLVGSATEVIIKETHSSLLFIPVSE